MNRGGGGLGIWVEVSSSIEGEGDVEVWVEMSENGVLSPQKLNSFAYLTADVVANVAHIFCNFAPGPLWTKGRVAAKNRIKL